MLLKYALTEKDPKQFKFKRQMMSSIIKTVNRKLQQQYYDVSHFIFRSF